MTGKDKKGLKSERLSIKNNLFILQNEKIDFKNEIQCFDEYYQN
jgi:hypothetical protein